MKPKFYKPDEIRSLFETEKPKYVSLLSKDGKQVFAKNQNPKVLQERFEEINKALPNLNHGIYYFTCQNSIKGNPEIFKFPVIVGDYNEEKIETMAENKINSIWTPEKALEVLSENNKLKLEVENLKKIVDDLESEIDELEDEIEQKNQLSEGNTQQSVIEKVLNVATPLIDKYFTQRDEQIKLQQMAVASGNNPAGGSHRKPPVTASAELKSLAIRRVNELIESGDNVAIIEYMSEIKSKWPDIYNDIILIIKNQNN